MYPEITLWAGLTLRSYNLMAALAVVCAFIISLFMLKKAGLKFIQSVLIFVASALFFLIGARLLNYVINHANYVKEGYSVFELSFGHFSVFGGMALACIPPLFLAKAWKKDLWRLADSMVFAFIAAFALMRVGCFLNGCCYGKECDVFWGVPAPQSVAELREAVNAFLPSMLRTDADSLVYPTQLMEMGLALLFLPLGTWLYKERKSGIVISAFVMYFPLFRLLVLNFRELPYSTYVINVVYPVIYSACFLAGTAMLIYNIKRQKGSGTDISN